MQAKIEPGAQAQTCLTVDELRLRLASLDGSTMVMMPGPEGGLLALADTEVTPVVLNVNSDPHFGPHDKPYKKQRADVSALVLHPGL